MSMLRRFAAVSTITVLSFAAACGSDDQPHSSADRDGRHRRHDGSAELVVGQDYIYVARRRQQLQHRARRGRDWNVLAGRRRIPAPTTAGTVTFTDTSLKPATLYRYRVITVLGIVHGAVERGERHHKVIRKRKRGHHDGHHGEPHALRGHRLHAQGLHPRHERRDADDSAPARRSRGTSIRSARRCSSCAARRSAPVGTADLPIVFTSSRAAGQRQPGDWGGLILVGNAPSNRTRRRSSSKARAPTARLS